MNRTLVLLPALALVFSAACGSGGAGSGGQAAGWTGARALTSREDAPGGVTTDGNRVLFTTGRNQAGENAVREATLDGVTVSLLLATLPGGQIPNGRLAIDGGVVYIPAGTGILRMPISGGPAVSVVKGRPAITEEVVVTADELWWTTYQYGEPARIEVARMPKGGGPVEVVAVDVAGALNNPFPDAGTALVASPKGVLAVRAGRPPEVVVSAEVAGGAVTRLAMDAERLYLLTAGDRNRLLAVPRRGGTPVVLSADVDSTADLVLVGDQVVFFQARRGSSGRSTLQAVPGAGGEVRTIATGPYAYGDLAAVGSDRVVFSADSQVWVATVRS